MTTLRPLHDHLNIFCLTGSDARTLTASKTKTNQENHKQFQEMWPFMKKDLLWTEAKDMWYVHLDPLWADFHATPSTGSRPIPFIDAFPVSLWLYKQDEKEQVNPKPPPLPKRSRPPSGQKPTTVVRPLDQAKMHLLVHICNLVSVQLNHYQFLFLMRLLETISEITTFLTQDVSYILDEADESSLALALIAPQVDVSLLMPSISQSKDNIGGDFSCDTADTTTATSLYSIGKKLSNF